LEVIFDEQVNTLGFAGSLRQGSYNQALGKKAENGMNWHYVRSTAYNKCK